MSGRSGSRLRGWRNGMIHHVSIPVTDTRHVIEVLQDLLGGVITEFGPYPDSWILWTGDEHGTAIEVYPVGTEMYPPSDAGQALFRAGGAPVTLCGDACHRVPGPYCPGDPGHRGRPGLAGGGTAKGPVRRRRVLDRESRDARADDPRHGGRLPGRGATDGANTRWLTEYPRRIRSHRAHRGPARRRSQPVDHRHGTRYPVQVRRPRHSGR